MSQGNLSQQNQGVNVGVENGKEIIDEVEVSDVKMVNELEGEGKENAGDNNVEDNNVNIVEDVDKEVVVNIGDDNGNKVQEEK